LKKLIGQKGGGSREKKREKGGQTSRNKLAGTEQKLTKASLPKKLARADNWKGKIWKKSQKKRGKICRVKSEKTGGKKLWGTIKEEKI